MKMERTRNMVFCALFVPLIAIGAYIRNPGYQQFAYERGVFSRPFLHYMYAMVPYVITEEELRKVLTVMKEWFFYKIASGNFSRL